MRKGLLLTLPRHDDVTEYLSQFSQAIGEEADKQGIECKPLKDENANRAEFDKVMNKLDYRMIVFNGHGSADSIKGYKDETLVAVGDNEEILKDRIVYARACEAGEVLGKVCTNNTKEGCFIGYRYPFRFLIESQWITCPLKDTTAAFFLEPSNQVPISLIKGHTTQEAHENSQFHLLKSIKKVMRSGRQDSFLLIEELWNNYDGQVLHGNPAASL